MEFLEEVSLMVDSGREVAAMVVDDLFDTDNRPRVGSSIKIAKIQSVGDETQVIDYDGWFYLIEELELLV